MNALSNKAIDDFRLRVNGARADIQGLWNGFSKSTGATKEACRVIRSDKLWHFQKMTGEFHNVCLGSTLELQARLRADLDSPAPPSDKPSAPLKSVPSH